MFKVKDNKGFNLRHIVARIDVESLLDYLKFFAIILHDSTCYDDPAHQIIKSQNSYYTLDELKIPVKSVVDKFR